MAAESQPQPPATHFRRVDESRGNGRRLALILLVAFVWRVASLFDPPWVNDEGTYFAVGQAMAHGYRLYNDVWENKPPLIYLLYTAVYHLVGPSLLTIRIIATLTALLLVLLTYQLARVWTHSWPALAAATLVGLLLGVPFLEGTTANAEIFLTAASAGAVLCVMRLRRGALGGSLMGIAIFFKAVAGFDALVLALLIMRERRDALPSYITGIALTTVAILVPSALNGILPAMLDDAFLYDVGYVGRMNGLGVPWLLAAKVTLLLVLTVRLRRAPFPVLWLLYALAGALVSGRVFGHYLIQCMVPLCLCVALLIQHRESLGRRITLLLPPVFLGLALLSALIGSLLAMSGHESILARRLSWYTNFVRYAAGGESQVSYRNGVDDHVSRNMRIAAELRTLPAGKVVVWGNTPWVYVLSGRLPATPYTSSLRDPQVPGETQTLRRAVDHSSAREIVVIHPPAPSLGGAVMSLRLHYRKVDVIDNATIYLSDAERDAR